jgi:molecular chaperone DnaK
VGKIAKQTAKVYPDQVVELVKRSMGDVNYRREIFGKEYRPEALAALILKKLKEDAERALSCTVTDAVITVPAYFNEAQRTATEQAGVIAGLNVRAIIPEPTAAAIAYAQDHGTPQTILVYDLGGGTFDVTVMKVGGGSVEVICVDGDHDLGGRNWDECGVAHYAEEWRRQTTRSDDPLESAETAQEFLGHAEDAKRTLTKRGEAPRSLSHAGASARIVLTREKFDELTAGLLERTIQLTRSAIDKAKEKGVSDIDRIILVGGSSYMPQVGKRLREEFGRECELFDPDLAVAKGAALYAANKQVQDVYADVLRSLFGKTEVNVEALPAPEKAKVEQAVRRKLPGWSGAAIESGREMSIINVCSKSFGVEALDEHDRKIIVYLIKKNSQVPAEVEEDFETHTDNQETAEILIMEAEGDSPSTDPAAGQAAEIKRVTLHLSSPSKRGSPITIRYSLSDDGGRLRVNATEKNSGKSIDESVDTFNALTQVQLDDLKKQTGDLNVQ